MRKRIRQSLTAFLVLAMMLSGLQSVGLDAFSDNGDAEYVDMSGMDHDCTDCATQDCCATQSCQMTSHCVSFAAVTSSTGLPAHDQSGNSLSRVFPPILPSALISTIYRPPWV
jgi:hypothetical protein